MTRRVIFYSNYNTGWRDHELEEFEPPRSVKIRDVAMALKAYPTNQIYAGAILNSSSSVNSRGLQGQYRSSTNASGSHAYRETMQYALQSGVSNATPGAYSGAKSYGLSVRCIAAE